MIVGTLHALFVETNVAWMMRIVNERRCGVSEPSGVAVGKGCDACDISSCMLCGC